jgi:hypothetical protein
MRQAEMSDSPILQRHHPGDQRRGHRAFERGRQGGAPAAADVRQKPLQDPEIRVTGHPHADALIVQVHGARHIQLRVLPDQAHVGHAQGVAIERHAERRGVADRIVE